MANLSIRNAAPASQRQSDGIEIYREGQYPIDELLSSKKNKVIPPEAFYLDSYGYEGFAHDLVSSHKVLSVIRTRPASSFFVLESVKGKYYPAFIMYDPQGEPDHVVTIFSENERKGVVVAKNHDNRSYLYVLSEPCDFDGRALITFMTPESEGGTYRIENVLLLAEKPENVSREYTFSDVKATVVEDGKARVTWRTNWATRSKLEYGPDSRYGTVLESEDVQYHPATPTYAQTYAPPLTAVYNNHRLVLEGLKSGKTYHFRIFGTGLDGSELTSEDFFFEAVLPEKPKGHIETDSIVLRVKNRIEAERRSYPVTSGVPFPRGALGRPGNTRILDSSGSEIPLQTSVLAEWPDGSVKWLLLDFQADVGSEGVSEYTLEFGSSVQRQTVPQGVTSTRKGSSLEVKTGSLKLRFDEEKPAFPARIWLDPEGEFANDKEITDPKNPGLLEIVDSTGEAFSSMGGPCAVELEEEGPLRSVLKITGEHRAENGSSLFRYVTRVTVYAGKSFIRIFHTFENSRTEEIFTKIKSYTARTPLRLGEAECTLIGDAGRAVRCSGNSEISQIVDDEYSVIEDGKVRDTGRRADGAVHLNDGKRGLAVGVRNFWQNYPKSLGVENGAVNIGICPSLPADYGSPEEELEDKLYYYLLGGEYKLKQGVSKTHGLVFEFHESDFDSKTYTMNQEPLLATAPPEWYCESKAFGDVAVVNKGSFPSYEEYIEKGVGRYLETREEGKEYGMQNFGDWFHVQKWGNMEYDTPHVFLLQYIRSGDPRCFQIGEETARHYMDVDTCRYHMHEEFVDRVYAHCISHVGDYYPYYYRKGGAQGVIELEEDHTWMEGLLDYYFLTGYRRAFETAKRIADKYDSLYSVNYDFSSCRRPGWHLIMSTAMYQATGDEFFLNAAKLVFDRVRERQSPKGWPHQLLLGHCSCLPRHQGNADFMVAILLTGLRRLHEATGDEAVAKSIVEGAKYLVNNHWIAEKQGFKYTGCPSSGFSQARNSLVLEGPSYAYRLSGNDEFKEVVLSGIDKGIEGNAYKSQPIGKHVGERACVAPHILYDIERYMR